ncbi:MAG: ATP-binding protein [Bacteroidota bacterium]
MEESSEVARVFIISSIGLIIMLVFALATVLFYVYYQRNLLKKELRFVALKETQQKQLLTTSVRSQEKERHRIASDLHDGIGMLLTSCQLFVRKIPATGEIGGIKQIALDILDEAIDNIRDISHDLSPQNLVNFGLVPAIEDLVENINQLGQLNIAFTFDEELRLHGDSELALYRIIQELISNTLKHAQATHADLVLSLRPEDKTLTYQDNGRGLQKMHIQDTTDGLTPRTGHGLNNITSRVQLIGGSFTIADRPDVGFNIQVRFKG